MDDTYERTYSQTLAVLSSNIEALNPNPNPPPSTIDDHAIACALAGIKELEPQPLSDTRMDEELAFQLHEREASRLLRPSSKARRRSKKLRSLLHHLKPTRVRAHLLHCLYSYACGRSGPAVVQSQDAQLVCEMCMHAWVLTMRPRSTAWSSALYVHVNSGHVNSAVPTQQRCSGCDEHLHAVAHAHHSVAGKLCQPSS